MAVQYLNNNQYAKKIGVSRSAIGKAIKAGRIFKENEGINPLDARNVAFVLSLPKTAGQKRGKKNKSNAQETILNNIHPESDDSKEEFQNQGLNELVDLKMGRQPQSKSASFPQTGTHNQRDLDDLRREKSVKNELEILKVQKEQIKMAKEMNEFIPFEWVSKLMSKLNGAIQNYFLPLDERLTPDIMAICKVSDAETELKIKKLIGEETENGLRQIMENAQKLDFIKSPEFKGDI